MKIAIAFFCYTPTDCSRTFYHELTNELLEKRFIDDVHRKHFSLPKFAYLFDEKGNILNYYQFDPT